MALLVMHNKTKHCTFDSLRKERIILPGECDEFESFLASSFETVRSGLEEQKTETDTLVAIHTWLFAEDVMFAVLWSRKVIRRSYQSPVSHGSMSLWIWNDDKRNRCRLVFR
ncbi:alkyl hydroperoxide reductase/ thiol specific antioxidant/ Mal allergen [Anopheles sinensis]|uniref:Alkyl hydroperoxide reductase/ thiol specific antioxidant/ Mal allergen n=1 Tax=Anopheles sinensis TaxID=74873 RepID=A0A084VKT0_ANOSI|nr:alkyl hydroperoxide reductase/ thiol specific antioxidant/ Mal allergen [Anopheles sinensis]